MNNKFAFIFVPPSVQIACRKYDFQLRVTTAMHNARPIVLRISNGITLQVHVRELQRIPHARAIYRAKCIASRRAPLFPLPLSLSFFPTRNSNAIGKKRAGATGERAVMREQCSIYMLGDRSNFLVACCQVASKSLSARCESNSDRGSCAITNNR